MKNIAEYLELKKEGVYTITAFEKADKAIVFVGHRSFIKGGF